MYELTKSEKKELNNTWKFLNIFSKPMDILEDISKKAKTTNLKSKKFFDIFFVYSKKFDVEDYRTGTIKQIRKKYTNQQFYKYEKIINKLFWNLKKKLKPFIKNNKTKYKIINKIDYDKADVHYNSTVNSHVQFNEKNNKWYLLQELSKLDKIIMNIMRNRDKYEYYYDNPLKIKKYKNTIIEPYYNMNYPFPNANPMFYNENKKKYWTKKIKKMYYDEDYEKYWYKLIKP